MFFSMVREQRELAPEGRHVVARGASAWLIAANDSVAPEATSKHLGERCRPSGAMAVRSALFQGLAPLATTCRSSGAFRTDREFEICQTGNIRADTQGLSTSAGRGKARETSSGRRMRAARSSDHQDLVAQMKGNPFENVAIAMIVGAKTPTVVRSDLNRVDDRHDRTVEE
jgi:hypothetical protein